MRGYLALAFCAIGLAACQGSQTGKALNAYDFKYKDSIWNSDHSGAYNSHSFWYSGYSDEDIEKAGASDKSRSESGW